MTPFDSEETRRWAFFDLSTDLLARVLKLPPGTQIERMHPSNNRPGAISIVVSNPEFREVPWGEWLPRLEAEGHLEDGKFILERWEEDTAYTPVSIFGEWVP